MDESIITVEEGCIVANKWKVLEKIAAGGFGSIFQAQNIATKEIVALKTEKKAIKDYLKIESDVYKLLSGKCGFPKFIYSGKTGYIDTKGEKLSCRILVMEVLGASLSDLFYQMNKKFSLKTVLLLGIQMIDRLADLHSVGIVHRDIKPGNFVMGIADNAHVVYLLDFGLSHSFRDPKTNKHIPYQENVAFRGTHRYASINAHRRIEQSRRDDLEALGYVLIYFLKGLPWANLQVERKDRRKVIGEAKAKTPLDTLTEGLPDEFQEYIRLCQSLEFAEDPQYEVLKNLFKKCLLQHKLKLDTSFDWTTTSPVKINNSNAAATKNHNHPEQIITSKKRKLSTPDQKHKKRRTNEDQKDEEDEVIEIVLAKRAPQPHKPQTTPAKLSHLIEKTTVIEILSDDD